MSLTLSFFLFLPVYITGETHDFSFDVWRTDEYSLFPKLPIAIPWAEDELCRKDSQLLLESIRNHTFWAMQMYDSSTQTPYGVLFGNMFNLGNFDECMLVKYPIKSQLCLMHLIANISQVELPYSDPYKIDPEPGHRVWSKLQTSRIDVSKLPRDDVVLGLCVPRSCSRQQLEKSLNFYLKALAENVESSNVTYSVSLPEECANDDYIPITTGELVFWIFSGSVVCLTIISTSVHYNSENVSQGGALFRILMAFSLRRNVNQFLRHEEKSSPLDFLYGIKFITIVLIIYDHRVAIFLGATVFNYQVIEEELRAYNNLFLPHGDLLVDSFFFIGGLLSCYLLLDVLKARFVNPFLILFARYMRLAPLYMFIVWFNASALMRMGSGAAWQISIGNETRFCVENWWTNALFVNNYVNPERMCLLHAWFLACDFHFFTCCVLLVMLIKKHRRFGLSLLFVATILTMAIPAIVATIYKLKPTVIFYNEFLSSPREDATYLQLYVKSHTRATVYLMGIITGYYLFEYRASTKTYGKVVSVLGNVLGLALLFAPMLYGSQYYHPGREYDPIESGIFAAFRRVVWALGCVVVMFTYRFGSVPFIGPLCSSHMFIVLSKLSYGMYLVHFVYQVTEYAKAKLPSQLIIFDLFTRGTSDVVASMSYALVLYLLIELPTRTLFKELIFSRTRHKKEEPIAVDNPTNKPDVTVYTVKL